MTQTNMFPGLLTEEEIRIINEGVYYAVREHFNQKFDKSKTDKMRKALDIMKSKDDFPSSKHICKMSLNDFLDSCEMRGWSDEIKDISWLEVRE